MTPLHHNINTVVARCIANVSQCTGFG